MQAIRPSIEDNGNGGVFVHLHDECTNQRKAIRRSDPVHPWGNRFSILYIRLSRSEAEVLLLRGLLAAE
jgi:hypothetical protein